MVTPHKLSRLALTSLLKPLASLLSKSGQTQSPRLQEPHHAPLIGPTSISTMPLRTLQRALQRSDLDSHRVICLPKGQSGSNWPAGSIKWRISLGPVPDNSRSLPRVVVMRHRPPWITPQPGTPKSGRLYPASRLWPTCARRSTWSTRLEGSGARGSAVYHDG